MVDVPQTVPCPCGNGYAERRPKTIDEPGILNRRRITHLYRHDGCPIGGHIVVEAEYILAKHGPLFRRQRGAANTFAEGSGRLQALREEV